MFNNKPQRNDKRNTFISSTISYVLNLLIKRISLFKSDIKEFEICPFLVHFFDFFFRKSYPLIFTYNLFIINLPIFNKLHGYKLIVRILNSVFNVFCRPFCYLDFSSRSKRTKSFISLLFIPLNIRKLTA